MRKTKNPNVVWISHRPTTKSIDFLLLSHWLAGWLLFYFRTLALSRTFGSTKRLIYLNAKHGIRVQIECIDFTICNIWPSHRMSIVFLLPFALSLYLSVCEFLCVLAHSWISSLALIRVVRCGLRLCVCILCGRDWISGCSPVDFAIYLLRYNGQLQICELCRIIWQCWGKNGAETIDEQKNTHCTQLEIHRFSMNSIDQLSFFIHCFFHFVRLL